MRPTVRPFGMPRARRNLCTRRVGKCPPRIGRLAQAWNAALDHLRELSPPVIANEHDGGKTSPRQHEHYRRYQCAPLKKHS
jgi:hypothetical protein